MKTIEELKVIGEEIYKSQMFGVRNPSEGFIIASICDEENISKLRFKEDYTLIQGNVGKRADAILASFVESGGAYTVKEKTADKCVIIFTINKEKYESVCDWKDLIKEPFTHVNKDVQGRLLPPNVPTEQKPLKDKYATPYSRRQMLFARCVSDGVRTICPIACKGRYTPEEISDFAETDETPKTSDVEIAPQIATIPTEKPLEPPKESKPIVNTPKAEKPQETQSAAPIDNATVDFTICRIPQCQFTGRKWETLQTDELQYAFDNLPISDVFTAADRDNIKSILIFRNAIDNSNIPADN